MKQIQSEARVNEGNGPYRLHGEEYAMKDGNQKMPSRDSLARRIRRPQFEPWLHLNIQQLQSFKLLKNL